MFLFCHYCATGNDHFSWRLIKVSIYHYILETNMYVSNIKYVSYQSAKGVVGSRTLHFFKWVSECHQFLYLLISITVWRETVPLREKKTREMNTYYL